MSFPTRARFVAILALVIASAGTEARAGFDTETFTVSTPMNAKTDFSQTLSVPAFNVANGILLERSRSLSRTRRTSRAT